MDNTSIFKPIIKDGTAENTGRLCRNYWDPVLKHPVGNYALGMAINAGLRPWWNVHYPPDCPGKQDACNP